jgi:cytochrome c-type biogenesis protein CcmH
VSVARSFWLWLLALVAVGVLAAFAAPHAPTAQSRISHLESLVRCPSCEDLSVAQSNATSALAVRHEIAQGVRRGESDSRILTSLESAYGTSILLSPPTSGLGALLWLVPAGLALAFGATVVRLWRRR